MTWIFRRPCSYSSSSIPSSCVYDTGPCIHRFYLSSCCLSIGNILFSPHSCQLHHIVTLNSNSDHQPGQPAWTNLIPIKPFRNLILRTFKLSLFETHVFCAATVFRGSQCATIPILHLTLNHLLTRHSSHSKAMAEDNPGLRPKLPVPDDPKFIMARFASSGNEREDLGFRQTQTGAQSTARMAEKITPLDKILRPN